MGASRLVAALLAVAASAHAGEAITVAGRVRAAGEPAWRAAVILEGDGPAAPPAEAHLDEVWLSFVPKVQVVPVGSTLVLGNRDDASHTVHGHLGRTTLFQHATAPGGREQRLTLDAPGVVEITCDMHDEMRAFIVVSPSALYALADEEGSFAIPSVAPGRYRVRVFWDRGAATGGALPPVLATVDVAPGMAPLDLGIAAAVTRASRPAPPKLEPPAPQQRREPSLLSRLASTHTWPRGWPVYPASALAVLLGLAVAVANLRFAARTGRSRLGAILVGCALSVAFGALIAVGLNGAVATALGFGVFLGTAVFGAADPASTE